MVAELFSKWMNNFIKYTKPSKEEKVILILDDHASHCSLDALLKAKENGFDTDTKYRTIKRKGNFKKLKSSEKFLYGIKRKWEER